jgi:hypothetical protein
MNEENIQKSLRPAFEDAHTGNAPVFDKVWANAEVAYDRSQRRYRMFGGVAAAIAVLGIVAFLWPAQQEEFSDDYFIADALMNSTSWSAPSDALMPEHQFDIYQEIPFPGVSTDRQEGSLL